MRIQHAEVFQQLLDAQRPITSPGLPLRTAPLHTDTENPHISSIYLPKITLLSPIKTPLQKDIISMNGSMYSKLSGPLYAPL